MNFYKVLVMPAVLQYATNKFITAVVLFIFKTKCPDPRVFIQIIEFAFAWMKFYCIKATQHLLNY